MSGPKAETAFRTIGEVAEQTGLPQHRLRYWEQRFPQLRPLTRAGQRRYYRPEDVALVQRIDQLLNQQGYTIRGVQKLLEDEEAGIVAPPPPPVPTSLDEGSALKVLRDFIADALAEDGR